MSNDLSNEQRQRDSDESNPQETLEANIETLRDTLDEMETAVGQIQDRPMMDSIQRQNPENRDELVKGGPVNQEVCDLLETENVNRLVITNFDTAISLLEHDQTVTGGPVKIVLATDVADQLADRFPVNSYFQKVQENDDTAIRQATSSETALSEAAVSDDRVYYPVSFGTLQTYLQSSDDAFYRKFVGAFDTEFADAEALDLAVPAWGELLEGLSEATSPETAREFDALVEAATPENIDDLDEVSLALIAAARTGALQYNISKWGEEMNLASKATFSRRKSSLVDDGVITTESVQVEVGRPRDRLLLADDRTKRSDDSPRSSAEVENDSRTETTSIDTPNERGPEGDESDDTSNILDEIIREVLLTNDS